jgi:hypothetical protein
MNDLTNGDVLLLSLCVIAFLWAMLSDDTPST